MSGLASHALHYTGPGGHSTARRSVCGAGLRHPCVIVSQESVHMAAQLPANAIVRPLGLWASCDCSSAAFGTGTFQRSVQAPPHHQQRPLTEVSMGMHHPYPGIQTALSTLYPCAPAPCPVPLAQQDRREKESFFNYFYMAINVGSLIACTAIVYVQDQVSWTLGFAIPGRLIFGTSAGICPGWCAARNTSSAAAPSGALLDGSFAGSAADGPSVVELR